ncbi:immunoglobulin superfamily member 1-like [Stegostoma tigrinum]|uniref:immunoglobulin superfamily member 1-like n=1 Tax=Stegostoma tigrinum TaxID=3053191 RepID=UPI002870562D|nr:immunoglobulin superfamily member 1-like [Stegostoma tigrinum]
MEPKSGQLYCRNMSIFPVLLMMMNLHVLVGSIRILPKPGLSLKPSYEMFVRGETIVMYCRCRCPVATIYFYGGSKVFHQFNISVPPCDAYLRFKADDNFEGTYQCQCLLFENNGSLSSPSHPVQIHVQDKPSPPRVSTVQGPAASPGKEFVIITCRGEIRSRGGIFYLYKNQFANFTQLRRVTAHEQSVNFTVNVTGKDTAGNYSCLYQTEISGHPVASSFSESVAIFWKGKEQKQDHTMVMLVHLYLSVFVLILMVVIIVEHFASGSPLAGAKKDRRKRTIHVFTTGL